MAANCKGTPTCGQQARHWAHCALCPAYVQSIPVFSRLGCLRGTTGWPASARPPLLFERFAAALCLPNPDIPSAHKLSTNCQTSVHARRICTAPAALRSLPTLQRHHIRPEELIGRHRVGLATALHERRDYVETHFVLSG